MTNAYAIQRCCTTPVFLKQYESSTNALLAKFNVGLIDIKEFNCCGYPLKNRKLEAYVHASARNLALAEREGLHVMTLCNCCYASLKHANELLQTESELADYADKQLAKEGLAYHGGTRIRHILEILYHDVGLERIKEEIQLPLTGLKLAVHYGCHILRPSRLVGFDGPGTAPVFDRLAAVTGAEAVPWQDQSECCGSPMWGIHDALSADLMERKLAGALRSEADLLCAACPYCQLQFDRVQRILHSEDRLGHRLPSVLYTQLLGFALGISEEKLGLDLNEVGAASVLTRYFDAAHLPYRN